MTGTPEPTSRLTALELCAGAGGQALGLDRAGFRHLALVENDHYACETLRAVRRWKRVVRETDLQDFRAVRYGGIDLVAGGVPCPPFSRAGRRLGDQDARDLFPEARRVVAECLPRAVLIENVRNLLSPEFADYRASVLDELARLGYVSDWQLLESCNFDVPQLRPRAVLVAFRRDLNVNFGIGSSPIENGTQFIWPAAHRTSKTVGAVLRNEMKRNGWEGAAEWASLADGIAPTLVGGSKKHGGADLGPTQAKKQWRDRLGVDALGLADEPPKPGFVGRPRLTVPMAALLQGFPASWPFQGGKTAAYRQVGNAFPPPVAEAVGRAIIRALEACDRARVTPITHASGELTDDASAVAA